MVVLHILRYARFFIKAGGCIFVESFLFPFLHTVINKSFFFSFPANQVYHVDTHNTYVWSGNKDGIRINADVFGEKKILLRR